MPANVKLPFKLIDGAIVEMVYYGRGTACISSQVGCAVGCPFCASGSRGLLRGLGAHEMVGQVMAIRERGLTPGNVTVSGVGEPLHNPVALRAFMAWCREEGLPVSLTTTGSPLQVLDDFLFGPDNGLIISLHAGTAATHRRLIPRGPDYNAFWALLESRWPLLSRRRRRKIGINYLLLDGINDGEGEIDALIRRLRIFPEVTLHLLTLNPVTMAQGSSVPSGRGEWAYRELVSAGLNVRRANSWRQQSKGGCGTLVAWPGAGSPGNMGKM